MFSFFKKSPPSTVSYSDLAVDMHSHLMPGIDDGSTDVDNSLELIKGLEDLGFKRFIATPHIFKDLYPNTDETIDGAHALLTAHLKQVHPSTVISAAAEYYMDDHFSGLLESGAKLRTISGNMVLVEFSFVAMPGDYKQQLFQLQLNGYQPILAHPERYSYLGSQKKVYDELKNAGCLFQMNLLSLAGYYGKQNQEMAQYLLKQDYIDLVGTDLHHLRHLDALRNSPAVSKVVQELVQKDRLMNTKLI